MFNVTFHEREGNSGHVLDYCELLIDSSSDCPTGEITYGSGITFTPAPGSVAYIADFSEIYMKDNAGTWTQIGG